MSATIITLIDGVRDTLRTASDAESFVTTFDPMTALIPRYNLADMGVLHVTIVPRSLSGEIVDRLRQLANEHTVDIAVQVRILHFEMEAVEKYLQLVEEIRDHLLENAITGFTVMGFVNDPIYDPQHAMEMHQFTSVLSVVYREMRTI